MMDKIRETDKYIQLLLDATPISCVLWDKDLKAINCNLETLKLFEAETKEDFGVNFVEKAPEFQPNGEKSKEVIPAFFNRAFNGEHLRFEWMHQTENGEPLPCEVTLVRLKYNNEYLIAGFTRDLREHKEIMNFLRERKNLPAQIKRTNSVW
jgi:PAS domain-containing protein